MTVFARATIAIFAFTFDTLGYFVCVLWLYIEYMIVREMKEFFRTIENSMSSANLILLPMEGRLEEYVLCHAHF